MELRNISKIIGLASLFVGSLVTANFTSAKIALLSVPFIGSFTYPTGILAYSVTYVVTDVVNEVYGPDVAKEFVKWGFVTIIVAQILALLTVSATGTEFGIPIEYHNSVFTASTNIILGSITAYYISQNVDIMLFDRLKSVTRGSHLWLRNTVSTGTSQLVDAVVFTAVAFVIAPLLIAGEMQLSIVAAAATIPAQYILKLGYATLDTPIVYVATYVLGDTNE